MEDRQGRFWIGDQGVGLHQFIRSTGEFITYRHTEGDPHSLSDNRVYKVIEGQDGLLWLATQNGLNCFDLATEVFTTYLGGIWITTVEGAYSGRFKRVEAVLSHQRKQARHCPHNPSSPGAQVIEHGVH